MKLIIKNKFMSFHENSYVKNEQDQDVCRVKGKLISITHKKRIMTLDKKVKYVVRDKWPTFLFHSAFICDKKGKKLARVKRKLGVNQNYVIEGMADEMHVEGDFFGSDMRVYRNGEYVGSISIEFFKLVDTFVLDVADGQDEFFLVALVIAIDNIKDKYSRDSKS